MIESSGREGTLGGEPRDALTSAAAVSLGARPAAPRETEPAGPGHGVTPRRVLTAIVRSVARELCRGCGPMAYSRDVMTAGTPGPAAGRGVRRARALQALGSPLVFSAVLAAAAWLLGLGPAGRALEQKGLDLLFLLRGSLAPPSDLVIVAIDEPSFAELGLQWPWPRSLHARLVDRLRAAGATAIVLDILFAEPSTPAEDAALAAALARAGNVVLASDLQVGETPAARQTRLVLPLPDLARVAAGVGVAALQPDGDAVIRRAALDLGGVPTLAGAAARVARRPEATAAPFLVNHLGPTPAVPTVSFADALAPDGVPDAAFAGKIVLVGRAVGPSYEAGRLAPDGHLTPYFWAGRRLAPGVELHATILDTVLRDRAIRRLAPAVALAWTLAWSLSATALAGRLSPWAGLGMSTGLAAAQGGLALAVFAAARLWIAWLMPVAAILGGYGTTLVIRWRRSERERAFVRRAFQHYVHPAVVQEILADPRKLRLGGDLVEATVLFSDLEGFTRISERLSPRELVALLNEFLSAMTEVIVAHRGMLNRTIGDAILALWGVPVPHPEHALAACRAALAMQRRLTELNHGWAASGRPVLRMRIGIQTGEIVVGNVGSAARFDYTAYGDNVNLASRLESINKLYGTSLVIGEATARRVAGALELRELDRLRVVGRSQPVTIYECVAEHGTLGGEQAALLETFRLGRAAYSARDWAGALRHFEQATALVPRDGPSRLYAERARRFLVDPPAEDWDGVATAASKEG